MSWEYSCPRCRASLNPARTIVLKMSRDDVTCLIGMHPQPGKYEIYLPPNVTTEDGTAWDFSCPLCSEALMTEHEPNLCELDLTVDDHKVKILFSRIAGEHATFLCPEDRPCEEYGEDAERYSARKKEMTEQG